MKFRSKVTIAETVLKQWVVIDFETASALDVKKVGAWHYAEHPTTEILCLCFSVMGGEVSAYIPGVEGPAHMDLSRLVEDRETVFISFGDFERAVWREIMVPRLGFGPLENERWHDIQAAAAMKQMPLSVDHLSNALRLEFKKDLIASKFTIALSKPSKAGYLIERTPEVMQRVVDYCSLDVKVETEEHRRIGWLTPEERAAWLQNQKINQRGIAVDMAYVNAAKQVVAEATVPLIREFESTTGLLPGQSVAIRKWCAQEGVELPDLGKETLKEVFGEGEEYTEEGVALEAMDMPSHVRRALEIKRLVGASSVKKLDALVACTSFDGRARGLLQYHGTGPGRSAGRLFQPQNLPKPSIKINGKIAEPDLIVEAIQTGSAAVVEALIGPAIPTVVSGLRQALVSGRDKLLVSGDYSGIQARLVLALAGQHDKTAIMASGQDIYVDMAQQIYKRPIDKLKDPKERGVGKNAVLGLGFQMAALKFQLKYARTHSLDFCQTVVDTYRKDWAPKVPKLWYALQDAATRAVWDGRAQEAYGIIYRLEGDWLTATVPSGSRIWYYKPEKTREPAPWDADELRPGFQYWAMKDHHWQPVKAFGGQLTENVIMRMEADIVRTAMLKLEANGYPVVLEVHDEIVVEPLVRDADEKAVHEIMLDIDPWVRHLQAPVNVEGWGGPSLRYRK